MASTTAILRRLLSLTRRYSGRAHSFVPLVSNRRESNIAVRIDEVSKRYKIYHQAGSGWLKEILFPWKRDRLYEEFMAVKGASLDVERGEVVGIIGPNGAGKSTLLKMISGLLPIDTGRIEISGRVTAVMAMGVGIHPEFSGRENILYGAMLLGMSKREVLRKMPMIIEFSELGEFIDRPLRTYSTGMAARLLFAIAMSVDPDILIVDEALATGDRRFVLKCLKRIRQFCRSGATILFVSHDMALIQDLCHRAVFMNQGRIEFVGEPGETIQRYRNWVDQQHLSIEQTERTQAKSAGRITVTAIRLVDADGQYCDEIQHGDALRIEIDFILNDASLTHAHVGVGFVRIADQLQVGEVSTHRDNPILLVCRDNSKGENTGQVQIDIDSVLLLSSHYSICVRFFDSQCVLSEHQDDKSYFVRESVGRANPDALFVHPGTIQPAIDCSIPRDDRGQI